jgi:hypothetical protein
MSFLLFLLQIGDLFQGKFNWRGVLHLTLFIIMGLLVIGFSVFFIRVILKSRKKNDD